MSALSEFPYTIVPLQDDKDERIKQDFKGYLSGTVRVGPSGYFFQGIYREYAHRYYNFQLRPTDIFVISYPKSGTTWTQELVWLLVKKMDFEGAKEQLDERFPFIEADSVLDRNVFQQLLNEPLPDPEARLTMAVNLQDPRTLKSHMPFSLLPPHLLDTSKVIYVARDPRDVVVSYYHHHRMWLTHGFTGDFKSFFKYFLSEEVLWSPFWSHIAEAWALRNHPNLLIITYEELKADLPVAISKVAAFLGVRVSSDDVKKLIAHLHIDSMKNNPAVNSEHDVGTGLLNAKEGGFVRKGKSGGWRDYFDKTMQDEFEKWMTDKGHGLAKEFNWL